MDTLKEVSAEEYYDTIGPKDLVMSTNGDNKVMITEWTTRSGRVLVAKSVTTCLLHDLSTDKLEEKKYYLVK